ncbi:MAG TPA: PAS domain S-box protein [Planctomycetota bacterium]|nr:PAS domain S-box protein [Planctomycetota bacterium]
MQSTRPEDDLEALRRRVEELERQLARAPAHGPKGRRARSTPAAASPGTASGADGDGNDPYRELLARHEELRSREQRFRAFVDGTDELRLLIDRAGIVLYANPAVERLFGLPPERCVGRSLFERVQPRDGTGEALLGGALSGPGRDLAFESVHRDEAGLEREILWTMKPQLTGGDVTALALWAREVTEAKRYERALRESEAVQRAVLASTLDPTLTIDAHGTIQAASDSCRTVFGYEPEELLGRNVKLLMPEPHHSQHDQYLANYRRTGLTHILGYTREFQVARKDGELIDCELSVSRVDVPGRAEPLFTGSFRDVTERKRAHEALGESQRRLQGIFDHTFQYVGLLDPQGTVLEANQASLEAAGVERSAVVGKPFWETRWWEVSPEVRERLKHAIRAAAAGEFVRFETEHRGAGDRLLMVDFSLSPVRDEEGRVVLLIPEGRDITELKRAQRAETSMLRALATIGESAAVLAHEIKNPITAVNVALRAVAGQLGEDHKAVLEDLVGRMQRLEHLMRRTLSFSRPIELRPTRMEACALLAQVVGHMRSDIVKAGADVAVESEDPCELEADRQLLEEVLSNLLRNALEASAGRACKVRLAAVQAESEVAIRVHDDGPGIPEDVRANLFKPFVTSKRRGTGLGLAFCKKVVEEHGGKIRADKGPLGGALFEIRLPKAR